MDYAFELVHSFQSVAAIVKTDALSSIVVVTYYVDIDKHIKAFCKTVMPVLSRFIVLYTIVSHLQTDSCIS